MNHEIDISADGSQVSHGLNLTLELRDPAAMPLLLKGIQDNMERIRAALKDLHYVHFARFLPVRGNGALLVLTEFDGPVRSYVLDFAVVIGDIFDAILSQVRDHPPLPIREFPAEFIAFVEKNNRVVVHPPQFEWDDYPVFCAYPERTVIDIVGPRRNPLEVPPEPEAVPIAREDVQANILRGYRAHKACHYALTVPDAAPMRKFLAMVLGEGSEFPCVTFDKEPLTGPSYLMNIGVTAAGLRAMGVSSEAMDTFPAAFLQGPADPRRAALNGDTGLNAPAYWELGGPGDPVHFLVSLYCDKSAESQKEFGKRSQQLVDWWKANGIPLVATFEAEALPDGKVHFGYIDGLGQPRIAGVAGKERPDMQPSVTVGEFLLGPEYLNAYKGRSIGRMPPELCENATFAAIRVMEQDAGAFEAMLDAAADATQLGREVIAAKLMGRWRTSGAPVSQADVPVPRDELNRFDYAPTSANPEVPDDFDGARCPVGAHVRRMNPRSSLVRGVPYSRRILRRGMPYGPAWKKDEGPNVKRGLFGLFICSDLERQYEFILQQWANADNAASGIRGTLDPISGSQDGTGHFLLPVEGERKKIPLPRLVSTRGSVYLLLPGRRGLQSLASGTGPARVGGVGAEKFDPRSPEFLDNPYPAFARFREKSPVALVSSGAYKSYWVFSHELVKQACENEGRFRKPPENQGPERGLFFMDNPRHDEVRGPLDDLFANAIGGDVLLDALDAELDAALAGIEAGPEGFDLIASYSHRVTRNVFLRIFGIPESEWGTFDALATTLLIHSDRMLPPEHQAPAAAAAQKLGGLLMARFAQCPASPGAGLLCALGRGGLLQGKELPATMLNFALGGYLSTDFLIGTAAHNLLTRPDALQRYRTLDTDARLAAFEELKRFDAPFQVADRHVSEKTDLGGFEIPAGSQVTVIYGAANHDEKVFGADADDLKLDRKIEPGTNFVFGHGIHHCIGAPMASVVAPRALDRLLWKFPDLRPSGRRPIRYQNPYFRGFSRLPVLR